MKNSASENVFFIESDEEGEDREFGRDEMGGNESDYSNDSNDNQEQRKPSSYSMAWPQSYRSDTSCSYVALTSLRKCVSVSLSLWDTDTCD